MTDFPYHSSYYILISHHFTFCIAGENTLKRMQAINSYFLYFCNIGIKVLKYYYIISPNFEKFRYRFYAKNN